MRGSVAIAALATILATLPVATAHAQTAARLKDIARVDGVRDNPLSGLGLVFGLRGTGDGDRVLASSRYANLLRNAFATDLTANDVESKNVAVVIVTADLPPFAREGSRIDARVSSAGDARSIEGGVLLTTPLRGPDGVVYAIASGSLVGPDGQYLTAEVPRGAIVETSLEEEIAPDGRFRLILDAADFSTAVAVAQAINADPRLAAYQGPEARLARALDGRTIEVTVPAAFRDAPLDLISIVEQVRVPGVDREGTVVVNTRARTVVISGDVTVARVTIESGRYQIQIGEPFGAVPAPPAGAAPPAAGAAPEPPEPEMPASFVEGTRLEEIVRALRDLRAPPEDVISILQDIDRAGALRGRLVVE